ncbi:MAG TPA: OsmC family protein [Candidatus Thermoplasmatota archaeon]|nr:OsmC family protein [Candidatus Thermoplasmatota archaeon]
MLNRTANATWTGKLKDGKGQVSTGSKAIQNLPLSFTTRFEGTPGTNPEELIAAAHAGCFSMALSNEIDKAGLTPERVDVTATVKFEKTDAGFSVTNIHLDAKAKIAGGDAKAFEQAAEKAKNGCPISRLLAPGTKITMTARTA